MMAAALGWAGLCPARADETAAPPKPASSPVLECPLSGFREQDYAKAAPLLRTRKEPDFEPSTVTQSR